MTRGHLGLLFKHFAVLTNFVILGTTVTAQQAELQSGSEMVIREAFVLTPEGSTGGLRGRASIPKDPLEAAWLAGTLKWPDENQEGVLASAPALPDWKPIQADEQGYFSGRSLAAGWLVAQVDLPQAGVWLLSAQGHANVRVNDVPRVGDVYSNGMVEIPVALRAGRNRLVFSGIRGRLLAKLKPLERPIFLSQRDTTFPHVMRGERDPLWGALLLVNATEADTTGLELRISGDDIQPAVISVPGLLPLSQRKIPFSVVPRADSPALRDQNRSDVQLKIEIWRRVANGGGHELLDTTQVAWAIRNGNQTHRRTFVSKIDGSVQYYGVVPPLPNSTQANEPPALVLSLHGAGVEGEGQAGSYSPKPNCYIIAPTNRRAFGFDWEDWGRLDALEVLQEAQQRFQTNPRNTYLTGHSMGGHGTWHIGSLYPDRFAALGPSAGWISFSTYMGGAVQASEETNAAALLRRSVLPSDTLGRLNNLVSQGIYILHGDRDDNVPVAQARQMRMELGKFHPDFVYREQPGAGHWWGNPCVDWPLMFSFFYEHHLPESTGLDAIDFVTPSPRVSDSCFWTRIDQQQKQDQFSRIRLKRGENSETIEGTTENVRRLTIKMKDFRASDAKPTPLSTIRIDLDGSKLDVAAGSERQEISFERDGSNWREIELQNTALEKKPQRYGNFKSAFDQRFVLVFGTGGNDEENEWMRARARFDAETFWYRGNGSMDLCADTQFREQDFLDRNVIVYGNATVNSAWRKLLANCPIKVDRESWAAPGLEAERTEVAVLMVWPRNDSDSASIGAIGGTTLKSMKATHRLPIFSSGTGYPDALLISPSYLSEGTDAIRLVGYFGPDWKFENGEWEPAKK